jgi:signal transduction histidine kinase
MEGIPDTTESGQRPWEPGADYGRRQQAGPFGAKCGPPDWVSDLPFNTGRHHHHQGRRRHLMRALQWRRLRRSPDARVFGGVCGAVSDATGVDVTIVRIGTVLISVASAVLVLVYAVAWLIIPMQGEDSTIFSRAVADRKGWRIVIAMVPAIIAIEVTIGVLHLSFFGLLSLPAFLAIAVFVMVWRNAGPTEKRWINAVLVPMLGGRADRSKWLLVVRIGVGVAVAVGGIMTLILGKPTAAALRPVGGAALILAAFIVVFGPWWLRLFRDLMSERQARALADERTQIAAHVHDSVLQTLALIQRASDDPQHVVRLARAQERELRAWLFEGRPPGAISEDVVSLSEGVNLIQRLVEADHEITVQVVVVGDCPLDEGLRALLDAAKEATVNSAKWSGAPEVSIFAEAEADAVTLFVRDRGRGFDPASVSEDRQGIAQSIRRRVARFGGAAQIRSAPGEGAEVMLTMPRNANANANAFAK